MTFRFTLSHAVLGSLIISEPDGWEGAKIKLERHHDFFSLIEYYEGAANSAFIFYGRNDAEGIDGGIEFIRQVETTYGFDANITFLVEYAPEDITFSTVFFGQLDIAQKTEMKDNRMQVPVIRDDFWAPFVNRYETPVNLSDLVDLDGNAVDPVEPITVNLTSQVIRKTHYSFEPDKGSAVTIEIGAAELFIQFTPGEFELDEMEDFYHLTPFYNLERPVSSFDVAEEGTYVFDIQWTLSAIFGAIENHVNNLTGIYLQVNEQDPIAFTLNDFTSSGKDYTVFSLQTTLYLLAGDSVYIFAEAIDSSQTITYGFWGTNGLVNGPIDAPTYDQPRPPAMDAIPTYTRITADTKYPETQVEAYLIHDLIHGVLARIGLGTDPFYSEFFGGLLTTSKQYDADGCGWMYAIVKGLQLRQYTLAEKPFFISMKQIWEGINPILNLGLGYEVVDSVQVIRIEQKGHFIGDTPPVNFSNVREISSSYDQDFIFKSITTGYKTGKPEDISGIDDPYKQVRATRIKLSGKELNLESDFIASGLSIETTRRKTREKSADYKFDNNTFIISLNTDDLSPDVYLPELDENFASVTNLLNPETRYNLVLTPLRNLLRWANYLGGCLQSYLTSSYKFVSGEGNYDMTSDANLGSCARAVIGDNLSESADISLASYNATFGYFFLPILYDILIPMEKEEFDLIDRKQPIGISQTDSGHAEFHIKELEYEIIKGEAMIKAWPKVFFPINVVDQEITTPDCATGEEGPVGFDPDYQAVLDYATSQGVIFIQPSDRVKALQNQLVLDLKEAGVWDELDLLYVFASDGQGNFPDINWKNPGSFTVTGTAGYTQDEGYFGNGTTYYLDTHWDPATDGVHFTLNNGSAFAYSNTNNGAAGNSFLFGSHNAANAGRVELIPKNIGSVHVYGVNSAGTDSVGTSPVSSQGFFHIQRTAVNELRLFKNGAQIGTTEALVASDALNNDDIYILATNLNGSPGGWSEETVGIFGIGASLTGKEAALRTAWNTYFISL